MYRCIFTIFIFFFFIKIIYLIIISSFSQTFGSPLDFQNFVKKVGTKQKDFKKIGIQPTTQYQLNTGHKHFLGLTISNKRLLYHIPPNIS